MTETVKKPIWTRCKGRSGQSNGCGQRVFNDPVDIERHLQHCPADLERVVEKLEKRIEKLEKAEPHIPEQIDLDDVADDWPASEEQPAADTDTGALTRADAEAALSNDDDYFDDEEDDAPTPPIGASLYTPGALT